MSEKLGRPVYNFTGKTLEVVCWDGDIVVLEPVGELSVKMEVDEDFFVLTGVTEDLEKVARRYFLKPRFYLNGEPIEELPEPFQHHTTCIVREDVALALRAFHDCGCGEYHKCAVIIFPGVSEAAWHKEGAVRVERFLSYSDLL